MAEIFNYEHRVVQKTMIGLRGSLEEDKMFIKFELWQRAKNDQFSVANKIREISGIWVTFSRFKEDKKMYKGLLWTCMTQLQVPIGERPAIANKIFDVVAAAVSPLDPLLVTVWRVGHGSLPTAKTIPASRSSIQGLEPVTLVDTDTSLTCSICWANFEQECITRLPCKHHFHVHCVVQWLEISHLCPLCRYAMPTQD